MYTFTIHVKACAYNLPFFVCHTNAVKCTFCCCIVHSYKFKYRCKFATYFTYIYHGMAMQLELHCVCFFTQKKTLKNPTIYGKMHFRFLVYFSFGLKLFFICVCVFLYFVCSGYIRFIFIYLLFAEFCLYA